MKQNGGIIPSFVDLDGRIGGADRPVVGQRLRLGLQPGESGDRPARGSQPHSARARRIQQRAARHGRSEIRRRVARDDRRGQRATPARSTAAREYPTMRGARRLVWLAARAVERRRARGVVLVDARRTIARASAPIRGSSFSKARTPAYPETALKRDLDSIRASGWRRCARIATTPDKRLADNMLEANPAATDALVRADVGRARRRAAKAAC